MSKVPTPREAAEIRLQYPPDTRIELELMVDAYAVPPGTRGTVDHVDDMGNYGQLIIMESNLPKSLGDKLFQGENFP